MPIRCRHGPELFFHGDGVGKGEEWLVISEQLENLREETLECSCKLGPRFLLILYQIIITTL